MELFTSESFPSRFNLRAIEAFSKVASESGKSGSLATEDFLTGSGSTSATEEVTVGVVVEDWGVCGSLSKTRVKGATSGRSTTVFSVTWLGVVGFLGTGGLLCKLPLVAEGAVLVDAGGEDSTSRGEGSEVG